MISFGKFVTWSGVAAIGFLSPLWVFALAVVAAARFVSVVTLVPIALVLDAYGVSSGAMGVPWHIIIVGIVMSVAVPLRGRLRAV